MLNEIIGHAEERMSKGLEVYQSDLSKLRTGRAHPSFLEHIKVNYYNADTPLNQVAAIAIENPRLLSVIPWEKSMVAAIEKAIRASDLGLNPNVAGMTIYVPLPELTEESRKKLNRVVREESEKARTVTRTFRRDANHACDELLKEKTISEDECRDTKVRIQKLTDNAIARIDKMMHEKEADLMRM